MFLRNLVMSRTPCSTKSCCASGWETRALVPKQLTEETPDQTRHGPAIVDIAGSQAERKQLAPIIDHQMKLEPIKPADRGFALTGIHSKDAMLPNARCAADGQGGGVDEADPCAGTQLSLQIDGERGQHPRQQLNEVRVTDQLGELRAELDPDILGVKRFEGTVVRLLKEDGDGHDFTGMQLRHTPPALCSCCHYLPLPGRSKLLPELVHRTVNFEYTHGDTSRRQMLFWYLAS
jgi:hypothetical protein